MPLYSKILPLVSLLLLQAACVAETPVARQVSETGITHWIMGFGADTYMMSADGRTTWSYPLGTRDGWMLPNGNLLLTITRCSEYPGGAVLEVNRAGKTIFEYKGTQSEVDTSQALPHGVYLLTESGPKPRLLEVDSSGKILVEFPLQCQTENQHMETRMARKLKNGNYLVPHLIDKAVKEYTKEGKVVWVGNTPHWPFSALRQKNGNTLISCTHGNQLVELDKEGKTIWSLKNEDLPSALINDSCGMELLPNGHIVFTSYATQGADQVKLIEIDKSKKVVWTLITNRPHGLHQFHIVDTNGKLTRGKLLR